MGAMVGFDESGNTGQDLLSPSQPVYALASVHLPLGHARELRGDVDRELHFAKDRKSAQGRSRILGILSSPLLNASTVKVSLVHKPFMVTAKIVDLAIEPVMRSFGVDVYVDGAHLAMSNLLYGIWPVLAAETFAEVQSAFVAMIRRRDDSAVRVFYAAVAQLELACDGQPDFAFETLHLSRPYVEAALSKFTAGSLPDDLDPAIPCLNALVHSWTAELGAMEIVHDESNIVRRWAPLVGKWWEPAAAPIEVQIWNGDNLCYPLAVDGFTLTASDGSPLVQLADVVAGATSMIFASLIRPGPDQLFLSSLRKTPVLEWIIGASVWPSQAMSSEDLGVQPGATPWQADVLTDWLRADGA